MMTGSVKKVTLISVILVVIIIIPVILILVTILLWIRYYYVHACTPISLNKELFKFHRIHRRCKVTSISAEYNLSKVDSKVMSSEVTI